MVRLIGNAAEHPDGERPADHHIRSVLADRAGDIPPQWQPVFGHAVLVIQKLHGLYADFGRAQSLLFLAQRADLIRVDAVIRMRGDAQRAFPIFRQWGYSPTYTAVTGIMTRRSFLEGPLAHRRIRTTLCRQDADPPQRDTGNTQLRYVPATLAPDRFTRTRFCNLLEAEQLHRTPAHLHFPDLPGDRHRELVDTFTYLWIL